MKVVAIVQARMGSSRLPGKVLMDIGGHSVLSRVVGRLSRAKKIDKIVIATTTCPADDAIVGETARLGFEVFRGSEQDVLSRYRLAADFFEADTVVRVTSDCPLIDPGIVDEVVEKYFASQVDLAFNDVTQSFPRGLDAEVFSSTALAKADRVADQPYQREHVTPVFYERKDLFQALSVSAERDYSRHRWTLDTSEDLQLIRTIYSHFENSIDFTWRDALSLVERLPHLSAMNAHVVQKVVGNSEMAY